MYNGSEQRVCLIIHKSIEDELNRLGLLYRVFSRAKSEESINFKIMRNQKESFEDDSITQYSKDGKKIQDLFGVRVALYFPDDLAIAQKAIKTLYDFDSKNVDGAETDLFAATKCNFVFKLTEELTQDSSVLRNNKLVDNTFEVQFRTILSEGWHEVEHDLRYKCKDDWSDHKDLSRALNGIYASLETSDWGMMKLFEDLAYRHYKSSEWAPMLRSKFRLRSGNSLDQSIIDAINTDEVGKKIFRVDRNKVLNLILKLKIDFPLNLSNIVYFCNHFFIHSDEITKITPVLLLNRFIEHKEKYLK